MATLADEVKKLRIERRIGSQDVLADLSTVALATIKKLEAGTIRETRPSTLRLLARGLATDPDGTRDADRVEDIYRRLMRAAGFLPAERERPAGISRDDFIEEMARRTGRRDLAIAMSSVAWDYDEIPEAYRKILEAAILGLTGAARSEDDG